MIDEIKRRDKKIADDRKIIEELKSEIEAMNQLLDCAAANIFILLKEQGGQKKISSSEVCEALGKYKLSAERDGEGNYILEIRENKHE